MNANLNIPIKDIQARHRLSSISTGKILLASQKYNRLKRKSTFSKRKLYCLPKKSIEDLRKIELEYLQYTSKQPPRQTRIFPKRKVSTRRSVNNIHEKEDSFVASHHMRCRSHKTSRDKVYKGSDIRITYSPVMVTKNTELEGMTFLTEELVPDDDVVEELSNKQILNRIRSNLLPKNDAWKDQNASIRTSPLAKYRTEYKKTKASVSPFIETSGFNTIRVRPMHRATSSIGSDVKSSNADRNSSMRWYATRYMSKKSHILIDYIKRKNFRDNLPFFKTFDDINRNVITELGRKLCTRPIVKTTESSNRNKCAYHPLHIYKLNEVKSIYTLPPTPFTIANEHRTNRFINH